MVTELVEPGKMKFISWPHLARGRIKVVQDLAPVLCWALAIGWLTGKGTFVDRCVV